MKYDLAVVIPARNEMFLSRTVDDLIKNKRGKTEIIVGLDGEWANPPIQDHKDVTIVYYAKSQGQRGITNQCAKITNAKYIMKLDAHCEVGDGFDIALLQGFKDLGDDVVQIPVMYNLHAFDWVCIGRVTGMKNIFYLTEEIKLFSLGCDNRIYQGPTPEKCSKCGGNMVRELIWQPRKSRKSEFYRFDTTLHFQYHGDRKKQVKNEDKYVETMSAQGSCFVLSRDNYWKWDICDEKHGSWGGQGTEVACKAWLSGNRLITNRNCWYSHMFRTQGRDFGFPYPISGRQVDNARKYSRQLFLENTWKLQKHPLSWLIEKFRPLPDWHDESGKTVLEMVNKKGEEFYKSHHTMTKGIIFYTNNKVNIKLGHKARETIKQAGLPIVSVSMKSMDFGENYVYRGESGYLAYHKQILLALEKSKADIIFFCEHDVFYHPSHFEFTPPRKDVYYYNFNWWRVRADDGHAIHYDTHQVNFIVAYRDLLLRHYTEKVKRIERDGFSMRMGFEPGCNRRKERIDDVQAERFDSTYPCLDIRHGENLTKSRWSIDQFRNTPVGWVESPVWKLSGWDFYSKDENEPFTITNCQSII